jgi:hypothetical protein
MKLRFFLESSLRQSSAIYLLEELYEQGFAVKDVLRNIKLFDIFKMCLMKASRKGAKKNAKDAGDKFSCVFCIFLCAFA